MLQRKQKRDRFEKQFMNSCKEKLEDGSIDLEKEFFPDCDQSLYFIPNKKAKHWVPKTFSTSNSSHKRKEPQENTQKKKKVMKVESSNDESFEDDDINIKTVIPSEKERQKLIRNPIQIVFITKQLCKCSRCQEVFDKEDHKAPRDMLFMTHM